MKNTILTSIGFVALWVSPAMAEQQTYSRYGVATNYATQNAYDAQQAASQQHQQAAQEVPNTYMIYPGREEYGQNYGAIPRHPGDYRDAVDRGSWTGGGNGSRSFDIR